MSAVVKLRHKNEIYNERVVKECMRIGETEVHCAWLRANGYSAFKNLGLWI
jgi:hypothetical protein